jgi:hypothetical protein
VRDALACCGYIFDRGTPTKVVRSAKGGLPKAIPLTAEQIVFELRRLRRPVRLTKNGGRVPTMLPTRVARMYLDMPDEWNLPPLAGICTAPLLASDGSVRTAQGYDQSTGLYSGVRTCRRCRFLNARRVLTRKLPCGGCDRRFRRSLSLMLRGAKIPGSAWTSSTSTSLRAAMRAPS